MIRDDDSQMFDYCQINYLHPFSDYQEKLFIVKQENLFIAKQRQSIYSKIKIFFVVLIDALLSIVLPL